MSIPDLSNIMPGIKMPDGAMSMRQSGPAHVVDPSLHAILSDGIMFLTAVAFYGTGKAENMADATKLAIAAGTVFRETIMELNNEQAEQE
jgi:hypothetical protein